MRTGLFPVIVFSLALGAAACAQDTTTPPPATQNSGNDNGNGNGGGNRGGGYGQRGGRGGGYGGGMGMGLAGGRGVVGTVTEVGADHYTVKTESGDSYTIHFSVNTRMMKMPAGAGMGGRGQGMGAGQGGGQGQGAGQGGQGRGGGGQGQGRGGGNPPQPIKPTDIKVGDAIGAMGEIDATGKSVGAVAIVQLDPERAKLMEELQANYGKTWLMGKVTAIDGVKVTLMGTVDNAAHSFVADENTTFRKRRDPITLADIQVGDVVRAEGALKDGTFTATSVIEAGMPAAGTPNVPRNGPPPTAPQ